MSGSEIRHHRDWFKLEAVQSNLFCVLLKVHTYVITYKRTRAIFIV